jgi:hypothetical protein
VSNPAIVNKLIARFTGLKVLGMTDDPSSMRRPRRDISGEAQRIFVFRGAGYRKRMLEWYYDYLDKSARGAEIKRIRVWGSVGNKIDIVLEWGRE